MKFLLAVAIGLAPGRALEAQERGASSGPSPGPRRFFDRPIDYWQRGLSFEESEKNDPKSSAGKDAKSASPASDWGQVVTLPDGTLGYHELPKPLVAVLEDPTPEKIRAYFEWRTNRTGKILRAAELMKEFKASEQAKSGKAGDSSAPPALPPLKESVAADSAGKAAEAAGGGAGRRFSVRYFHRQGCPHCDTQDSVLSEWLRGKPEAKLEVIEFGSSPELWRAYQVRGTPSIVLEDNGTKRHSFLEGLSRAEALDRALEAVRAAGSREEREKGAAGK
jgi:hypothetical protein